MMQLRLALRDIAAPILSVLFLSAPTLTRALAADAPPIAAPTFTLPVRDGSISLESLRGKVVYVDFWASWCGPCKKSFPWMSELQTKNAEKGLVVVAINLDKKRELADAFVEQTKPSFVVAYDPAGKMAEAYKVKVMPSSFIIAPDGTLAYTHEGFDPKSQASIEEAVAKALAAIPPKGESK